MFKIIGTTHLTPQEEIIKEIKEFNPEIIGVELCETRLKLLLNPIKQEVKEDTSLIGKITNSIRKKADQENIQYGSDMITASAYAIEKKLELVLLDRDINEIGLLMQKIPQNEVQGFMKELQEFEKKTLKENISNIDEDKIINELKTNYPISYEILINSRNQIIVKNILKTIIKHPNRKFLIFLGKGHTKEINGELNG